MNYIKRFKDFLIEKGVSQNTVDNYINYVKRYFKWYEETHDNSFRFFVKEDLLRYVECISESDTISSIRVSITGLKKFNEFLVFKGIQERIVIDKEVTSRLQHGKVNKQIRSIPSEQVIECFRMYVCSKDSIRNYAIVTVLAYTGLKLSECIELKLADIDFDKRLIYVAGRIDREVPMDNKVEASLKLYLAERENQDNQSEYLFVSKSDKKLDRTMINKIFHEYKNDFNITTNTLREFYCSRLDKQGYAKEDIAKYAGYKIENDFVEKILRKA
jgi:integrase/recombinase XerD